MSIAAISGRMIKRFPMMRAMLVCLGLALFVPAVFCEESPGIYRKVAILPLRNISSGAADEKEIRKIIADVLKSKKGIEVADFEYTDKLLAEKGLSFKKSVKLEQLKTAQKALNVDGILFGNITTYHDPDEGEKSVGAIIPFVEAVAKLEVSLRLYDCARGEITWSRQIIGYSKPMFLKMESVAVNMDSAVDSFKKDLSSRWNNPAKK